MAQYQVSYACKHVDTINLYGPHRDRESRLEWEAARVCRDCYRESQTAAAAATAERERLPQLDGSEKQVAWALTIRAKQLAAVAQWIESSVDNARDLSEDQRGEILVTFERWEEMLKAQNAAKFWIDTRAWSVRELLLEMKAAEKKAAQVA